MKKLMFAVAAILTISLASCRNNEIENVNEEISFEKLKTDEQPPTTAARDSIPTPGTPGTGIGPIVITPPR